MTMFAAEIPPMPQPMLDLAAANPEGLAEAMGSGMEAMTAAMEGGASPAEAFEAMGEVMGPMMEEMGVSAEDFDAMADAFGATMGPAMHMAPADATGDDMGAIMQDGLDLMMPEGVDVPPVIMDAVADLGTAMGDAEMGSNDVGAEMMGDPGSDTYMLPVDTDGNAIVEPGQPETSPVEAVQAPPADGACASTDGMMPPEGGYDHAPMTGDMVMSEPYDYSAYGDQAPGGDGAQVGDTVPGDGEAGYGDPAPGEAGYVDDGSYSDQAPVADGAQVGDTVPGDGEAGYGDPAPGGDGAQVGNTAPGVPGYGEGDQAPAPYDPPETSGADNVLADAFSPAPSNEEFVGYSEPGAADAAIANAMDEAQEQGGAAVAQPAIPAVEGVDHAQADTDTSSDDDNGGGLAG